MGRYSAAKTLITIMQGLGWLIILTTVAATAGMFVSQSLSMAVAVGLSGLAVGLILLVGAQITLALIDTAENSFETVRLLQRQAASDATKHP